MVRLNFDLKQFMRVLYNTRTYQREVTERDVLAEETYYFPGPLLQRMSAEQLWDSVMTLAVPELDDRKGNVSYNRYSNGKELVDTDVDEILSMAKQEARRRKLSFEYREKTVDLQKQLRVASRKQDREKINEIRAKMAKIRLAVYGAKGEKQYQRERSRASRNRIERDPRWKGLSRELVRASEVSSPARPGHFLRQFGQSDRETIENANTEATVPQILTLLNGPIYYQLSNTNSALSRTLEAQADKDKVDVLFLSILSRRPTVEEKKIISEAIEKGGRRNGVNDVVWALLNTRQFIFVQ